MGKVMTIFLLLLTTIPKVSVKSNKTINSNDLIGNLIIQDNHVLYIYPSLAIRIGFNEAMVAHRLHILIRESDKVIGKWVMLSTNQWEEEFPFWSISTIQRTFQSLEDCGLVISRKLQKT